MAHRRTYIGLYVLIYHNDTFSSYFHKESLCKYYTSQFRNHKVYILKSNNDCYYIELYRQSPYPIHKLVETYLPFNGSVSYIFIPLL